MMVQFELNHKRIFFEAPCRITHNVKRISLDTKICTIPEPDLKPELFGQTRPEPDPKSKSPTRQSLPRDSVFKYKKQENKENEKHGNPANAVNALQLNSSLKNWRLLGK